MSQEIEANIQKIRERIAAAAARANRDPAGIRLMAVSKTVEPRRILKALEAGILLLGENYVQEAREKIPAVGRGAEWHMIGHLQTNKVKYVVHLFDWIHSVGPPGSGAGAGQKGGPAQPPLECAHRSQCQRRSLEKRH